MPRVKRGVTSHARHKRLRAQAKGYVGLRHSSIKKAREAVMKAWTYSYRDRRTKKRDFRALWIQRINAGARQHGLSYSQFMHGLQLAEVTLNRKMLADIAFNDSETFASLVVQSKDALAKAEKSDKKPVAA